MWVYLFCVDDSELAERLLATVTRIRRVLDARLQRHGVSVARKRVLGMLARGPARQSELAAEFDLTPRTITELVDGLTRDGLAERHDDPRDRRAKLVLLTEAGRHANDLAVTTRHQVISELFADLTPTRRADLAQTLAAIEARAAGLAANPEEPHVPDRR